MIQVAAHIAFEFFYAVTQAKQQHQVPAGRTATGSDACHVVAVLVGVGTQPSDGSFTVVDLSWVGDQAVQPVIDAGGGVAFRRQVNEHGVDPGLASFGPATTMNPDDQRRLRLGFLRQVQIEPQRSSIDLGILQVSDDFDAFGDSAAAPRPLVTISLSPLPKLLGGDDAVTVLVEPSEELGFAIEFVSLHLAISIPVLACRELLESDAPLACLILLALLCCDPQMDQGQHQYEHKGG